MEHDLFDCDARVPRTLRLWQNFGYPASRAASTRPFRIARHHDDRQNAIVLLGSVRTAWRTEGRHRAHGKIGENKIRFRNLSCLNASPPSLLSWMLRIPNALRRVRSKIRICSLSRQ